MTSTSAAALTALLILGCGPGFDARAETLLLTGATVHTISGATLPSGRVLIRDGRIVEVRPAEADPADGREGNGRNAPDRILRLDGMHLYPGVIAATTTLGLVEINAVRATRDWTEVGAFTPQVESWAAVNPDSELIPVARANGITHVLPVPAGGRVSGRSSVIRLSGWTVEDLVVRRDAALHIFWPSMTLDTRPKSAFGAGAKRKSMEEQDRERRERIEELTEFFEQAKAYSELKKYASENEPLVPAWEAMLPFVESRRPVMVHADEHRSIAAAVDWAEEHDYKIIIAGGRDAWRVAARLAEREIPVIYEHVFTQPPSDSESYDIQFRAPSLLHAAGVTVAFSEGLGGFGASGLRNLPYAAAQAAAFGLPKDEALKGITLHSARILGLDDDLGSIEPGKEATLIALDGDLLEIQSRVLRMWIAGQPIDLDSRHTRLKERYEFRPRPQ